MFFFLSTVNFLWSVCSLFFLLSLSRQLAAYPIAITRCLLWRSCLIWVHKKNAPKRSRLIGIPLTPFFSFNSSPPVAFIFPLITFLSSMKKRMTQSRLFSADDLKRDAIWMPILYRSSLNARCARPQAKPWSECSPCSALGILILWRHHPSTPLNLWIVCCWLAGWQW